MEFSDPCVAENGYPAWRRWHGAPISKVSSQWNGLRSTLFLVDATRQAAGLWFLAPSLTVLTHTHPILFPAQSPDALLSLSSHLIEVSLSVNTVTCWFLMTFSSLVLGGPLHSVVPYTWAQSECWSPLWFVEFVMRTEGWELISGRPCSWEGIPFSLQLHLTRPEKPLALLPPPGWGQGGELDSLGAFLSHALGCSAGD